MVRAVVLIVVFVGLLSGAAMSVAVRDALALGGIFGACMALNWVTSKGN
jgi:hypothetical protein